MRDATLCFPIRGNPPSEILLGLKKIGFGQGKYGGFGGKIEIGESIEAATIRELAEEAGIRTSERDIQRAGHLTFLFPYKPDWNQVVHVYLIKTWVGEPVQSTEMLPAWFKIEEIPYEKMWQDCSHWLPLVLAGKRITASFSFCDDNESVAEFKIAEWEIAPNDLRVCESK